MQITERLAELAIEYYQNQMTEKIPQGRMKKGEMVEPFPQNQYPRYFSIWKGKHPSLEDIRAENPHLAHAVEINSDFVREGIFDFNPDGGIIFDSIIHLKSDFERGK